ncbi:MAG: hypothetical protein EBU27_09650 [Opitutae bacterium]|jgi:hypothetical protein|nr:hypothetical protein [Opitutae bacterium]NBU87187.1 hypothetical protein [Verrucomicrobiota bacterium]
MFQELIDRISTNLGLTMEEALQSELVKKLCMDLVNGKVIVIVSKEGKISSMELESEKSELIETQLDRTS